jgi:predicted Ser/Thr protein kinase
LASSPPLIAKYHIVRRIGYGGMGAVYLGRDPDLDRPVAIKVLREPMADEELLQRFLREARATANLRHENLITIYEVGSHDQQPFIAMEYVDGTTLGELIKRRQALPLVQKLSFIEQICAGLHHAHRTGIVHRDIKPANVMVDAQGVIRILDFGIARIANSGMTSDGALIGTLNYMSPEQMLGRPVDFRSDIFSVGAVAYELLSFHQAFPGTLDDGLLHRLPQMAPSPLASVCPGLPAGLEEIVLRALAKPPHERFGDLDEMRTAVRHLRGRVDPNLELETVVIPSRDKAKPPASSAERRGLLERRARQIAVHRDAARAALTRGDLDSAAAACDDALTLDPDDTEATHLLAEIQQAKERREQESKARRDRERTMRQRVVDAEVTLARGDVVTAARLLEDVFVDEGQDPAALLLLDKVRHAATAAGVALPDTLNVVATRARTETAPEPTRLAPRTEPGRNRTPLYAAVAVVALAIGGGVVWMINSGGTTPVTETASVPNRSDIPASAVPPAPAPQVPAAVTPAPVATTSPAPPPPAPAATPSPAIVDSLAEPLARIAQRHQAGDVAGALADLARIGSTTDNRVSTLARSVAQSAFQSMDAALAAAVGQKAADLAPASYSAAEQARRLADAAASRNDHVESGTRALAASTAYRRAESEARAAMAARTPDVTPSKPAPPSSAAATPTPATVTPPPETPPSRAEVSAATSPPPASVARPSALDGERPGILRALNRYQDAYREKSVKALQAVYPSLPRETGQRLDKNFRDCRAYDVTFGNMQVALAADDPTAATVTVRTTYQCQPKTGQAPEPQAVQDIFILRKVGGEWLIDSTGMMDTARRR